jgi:hypothetical protein
MASAIADTISKKYNTKNSDIDSRSLIYKNWNLVNTLALLWNSKIQARKYPTLCFKKAKIVKGFICFKMLSKYKNGVENLTYGSP